MVQQFGIFAKYWEPGAVKTRLAQKVGEEMAARIHRASLETLLARFSHVADRRVLAYSPWHRAREFVRLAGSCWQVQPQASGDLGHRMSHYFATAFEAGCSMVILIGSDSPTLPETFVNEAFDRLGAADVVVGPADDGGYYLIGMSRYLPEAFDGIPWSTPDVLQQTFARLASSGRHCERLPSWYDVDTLEDLERLRAELASSSIQDFASLGNVVRDAT